MCDFRIFLLQYVRRFDYVIYSGSYEQKQKIMDLTQD